MYNQSILSPLQFDLLEEKDGTHIWRLEFKVDGERIVYNFYENQWI